MRPSEALQIHREMIRSLVEKHGAKNPRVFGSILYGEDTDESDIDLRVDPIDGRTTLTSLVRIKREIEGLTGVATTTLTRAVMNCSDGMWPATIKAPSI